MVVPEGKDVKPGSGEVEGIGIRPGEGGVTEKRRPCKGEFHVADGYVGSGYVAFQMAEKIREIKPLMGIGGSASVHRSGASHHRPVAHHVSEEIQGHGIRNFFDENQVLGKGQGGAEGKGIPPPGQELSPEDGGNKGRNGHEDEESSFHVCKDTYIFIL